MKRTRSIRAIVAVAAVAAAALALATAARAAESDWPAHSVYGGCTNLGYYGRYVEAMVGAIDHFPGVGTGFVDVSDGGTSYSNSYTQYAYYRVWASRDGLWWWSPYKRVGATGHFEWAQEQRSDGGWYAVDNGWNPFYPSTQNLAFGPNEVAVRVPAGATYAVWLEIYWDKPSYGYVYGGPLAGGWRHYHYLGTCPF